MAKTNQDKRSKRKRSSSKEGGTPPSAVLTLVVLGCFVLSILVFTSKQESLSLRQKGNERRYLLNNNNDNDQEEQILDIGEDNVWRRQLRKEQDEKARQRKLKRDGEAERMAAAAAIEGGENLVDGAGNERVSMRKLFDIPDLYPGRHRFDGCQGKTVIKCGEIIDAEVSKNPEKFGNNTSLMLDVRKIREETDESYFKVVLRTDARGQVVHGIMGDGMVYYPWLWRVAGVDNIIGPWNCSTGSGRMGPAECCTMIQTDVSEPNDAGDFLACFVEEPVGGPNNPVRTDRAIAVVDGQGRVVRPPIYH